MTYEEIVKGAKEALCNKDVSNIPGHLAVEIDIIGEGEGAFYIELKDGELFVEPYEYYDNDCKLIASAETFTKLIDGKLDAVLAFTTGKLRVEGSIDKALEFQKITGAKDKKCAKKAAAKAPAKEKAVKAPAKEKAVKAPAKEKAPAKSAK